MKRDITKQLAKAKEKRLRESVLNMKPGPKRGTDWFATTGEEYTPEQTQFLIYFSKWKHENKVKFPTTIQTITCYEEFNKS